jgi:predicted Zn-dependent protease with MMP-like domain
MCLSLDVRGDPGTLEQSLRLVQMMLDEPAQIILGLTGPHVAPPSPAASSPRAGDRIRACPDDVLMDNPVDGPVWVPAYNRGAMDVGHDDAEDEAAFEQLVRDALDELPDDIRDQMSNVAVTVEDEPPPGSNLLGLYQGIPWGGRGPYYAGALPDKITIYRRPLERRAGGDRERLRREVRRTVFHEIAHHFGISDERLLELGRY